MTLLAQTFVAVVSTAIVLASAPVLGQSGGGKEDCPPCHAHDDRSVVTARAELTEAFRLSLEVPDCFSLENQVVVCRQIEALLENVSETADIVFAAHAEPAIPNCLSCDPRAHLWPLVDGVRALSDLLQDKGYQGFSDSGRLLSEKLEVWKGYRCPCTEGAGESLPSLTTAPARDRDGEAQSEIMRKCGERFAGDRRGLLQTFRVPGDHNGCYQSRACREATVYKGFQTQPGFWSYDGEYWYIWAERRGNQGEWITCER